MPCKNLSLPLTDSIGCVPLWPLNILNIPLLQHLLYAIKFDLWS
jgi:hypothetical protein